jgi:hypothetical protein
LIVSIHSYSSMKGAFMNFRTCADTGVHG